MMTRNDMKFRLSEGSLFKTTVLTCSHSRSINASNPVTVLQSGFRMTCARDVTHNVISLPSDPWTRTDDLSLFEKLI